MCVYENFSIIATCITMFFVVVVVCLFVVVVFLFCAVCLFFLCVFFFVFCFLFLFVFVLFLFLFFVCLIVFCLFVCLFVFCCCFLFSLSERLAPSVFEWSFTTLSTIFQPVFEVSYCNTHLIFFRQIITCPNSKGKKSFVNSIDFCMKCSYAVCNSEIVRGIL